MDSKKWLTIKSNAAAYIKINAASATANKKKFAT